MSPEQVQVTLKLLSEYGDLYKSTYDKMALVEDPVLKGAFLDAVKDLRGAIHRIQRAALREKVVHVGTSTP